MTSKDTEPTDQANADPDDAVRVRRAPDRASYDAAAVHAVIDASLVAHVGTVRDGLPVVIPMYCVREGDAVLLHGAPASGVIRRGRDATVCVTMTVLDGLVLARSAFHHSMNYRSVAVIGEASEVTDLDERARCLDLLVERLVPGRARDLRPTTDKEVRATSVLRVPLDRASVKIRRGSPIDDVADLALPIWAGVVPVTTAAGAPVTDPDLRFDLPVPDEVLDLEGHAP